MGSCVSCVIESGMFSECSIISTYSFENKYEKKFFEALKMQERTQKNKTGSKIAIFELQRWGTHKIWSQL